MKAELTEMNGGPYSSTTKEEEALPAEEQYGINSKPRVSVLPPGNPLLAMKEEKSYHIALLIGCLIMWIVPPVVILVVLRYNQPYTWGLTIAGSYIVYLLLACCFDTLIKYLKSVHKSSNAEAEHRRHMNQAGYFRFKVRCYHY